MIRGLYTSASGMLAELHRQDTISNNLANVDTPGYKKDIPVFTALKKLDIYRTHDNKLPVEDIQKPALRPIRVIRERLGDKVKTGSLREIWPFIGKLGVGVGVDEVITDFKQGPIKATNNNFDMALNGPGFFKVQTKQGLRYTRAGTFTINKSGFLVTKDGDYVMGKNGPVQIIGNNLNVDEDGDVLVKESELTKEQIMDYQSKGYPKRDDMYIVNKLDIVDIKNHKGLLKEGSNLYKPSNAISAVEVSVPKTQVKQGFLEGSGVNVVTSMVNMISVSRAYEANQRVIWAHDSLLDKAVNTVGRV